MATPPMKVVASPIQCWYANTNATDPGVNGTPSAATWTLFADTIAIKEGGTKVVSTPTFMEHRTDGGLWVRKVWRATQELHVEFEIDETGADNLATLLGNNLQVVAAGSGTAGYRKVSFAQKRDVPTRAFYLVGNHSTMYANGRAYYYIPAGYFSAATEMVNSKGAVRFFKVEIKAVASTGMAVGDEIGYYVEQTTAPS